ncbi:glucosamine-6-phosphate deaminase [Rhizobium oryziradicis]|uniref:Glucosamine-6-phosphate deaminase n=1 Tax=Rhizobium oryziradicis TaxID=1867956 RepID=A0A1Q8ZKI9_9HYPH|nr:glucosamine-6-phosphate deaminase [Rhizobium oryziradicis]OLP42291.1 glucosamine-6-phosphate deaminase [Rhizobium oryziradicis]
MQTSSSQRHIFPTSDAAAQAVAAHIINTVKAKPDAVLGLATGATMEPVYAHLIAAYQRGDVRFSGVTTFNLDEYAGLSPSDPGSYRSTMDRLFFDHVDIDKNRTFLPEASLDASAAAGNDYEAMIVKAGGIDLQLLGIGRNGHIGFNEPGSAIDSRTRLVELHEETLAANAKFFDGGKVPGSAITMGIGTILSAREIVVLATGAAKADAVRDAHCGTFSEDCPASALQTHNRVLWFLDSAAADARFAA